MTLHGTSLVARVSGARNFKAPATRLRYGQSFGIKQPASQRSLNGLIVRVVPKTLDDSYNINVHGRHVDITPDLESYVRAKLIDTLKKMETGEYVEAEGGIRDVDVRLMNTRADIIVHPMKANKHAGDSFLRQGQLKADAEGVSSYDSFNNACSILEKKLVRARKESPQKKDYRASH